MKQSLLAFTLLLLVTSAGAQDKQAVKFAATITAADLKKKLSVIAGPEMQGRETATPGQRKAAAYIQNHFRKLGLKPGAGKSYQQFYPLYRDSLTQASLVVNQQAFVFGKDFALTASSYADTVATIHEVVLAGYGITDSLYDDYSDLDVKGKCVLVTKGEPKLENGHFLLSGSAQTSRSASINSKIANARKHGATMVLFYQPLFAENNTRTGDVYTDSSLKGYNTVIIGAKVLESLSEGLSKDLDTAIENGHSLSTQLSINLSLTVQKKVQQQQSSNVIAILPGTDKKDEYVFVTGHYDHLGQDKKGVIYYGADDDGSGTTSVLEIAEAFAKARAGGAAPRRTMVFMTVSGEEKGLLGSAYYTSHPTVSLEKTSVDLNIDMVGRIDPSYKGDSTNYLYVIGENKLSSDLLTISDSINRTYLNMELDRRYNDPRDRNRFYYRSDHFNFAKNGVPVIFYFNGTHADYHRPTDTVDKINFPEMEKRVKLVFFTAWEMANREQQLKRDLPLN